MLTRLSVSNFAIIEKTELCFSPQFSVITGETGAGKSILLDALALVLGGRANFSTQSEQDKKSIVEAFFRLDKSHKPFFEEHDLDFDEECILRRELLPSGKSRAFINDTPVSNQQLRILTARLLNLHLQHESTQIADPKFQRIVLDSFAAIEQTVEGFTANYRDYKRLEKEIQDKTEAEKKQQQQRDFLEFQLHELEEADLKDGEFSVIESELKTATNADEITTKLELINEELGGDEGILIRLQPLIQSLRHVTALNPKLDPIYKRLDSVAIELDDIANELSSQDLQVADAEDIQRLQTRIDQLNKLFAKHHVPNEEELLAVKLNFASELDSIQGLQDQLKQLHAEITILEERLELRAAQIHEARKAAAPKLAKQIEVLLSEVGMSKAKFNIKITERQALNAYGKDDIEFEFSANKGMPVRSIKDIASGGELSRLMLVLTTVIAGKNDLPTLIFDEIDTGISGEVAKKVGNVLQGLAHHHQIISITHSPQVAAKADAHFKISKFEKAGKTKSVASELKQAERVVELAEMLSGKQPSQTSIAAAKELMM